MIYALPLTCILSYLAGTFPSGLLLGKTVGIGDIRTQGSGNLGATNMVRAGGTKLGALTLIMDMAKGAAAVWLGSYVAQNYTQESATISLLLPLIAGFFAILGHCFPIWLKFKGGKGVATLLGVLLVWNSLIALVFALIWLGCFWRTKISSLSALAASASLLPCALLLRTPLETSLIFLVILLIFYKHTDNIKRLMRKKEHGFTLRS